MLSSMAPQLARSFTQLSTYYKYKQIQAKNRNRWEEKVRPLSMSSWKSSMACSETIPIVLPQKESKIPRSTLFLFSPLVTLHRTNIS